MYVILKTILFTKECTMSNVSVCKGNRLKIGKKDKKTPLSSRTTTLTTKYYF